MDLADLAEYRKTGDPKLKARLLKPYLPMIDRLARKVFPIPPVGFEHQDLVSYGYIGLLEAFNRYESKGLAFSTVAYRRAYGAMLDAVRRITHMHRSSGEVRDLFCQSIDNQIPGTTVTFADVIEDGRPPLDETVAIRLDLARAKTTLKPQEREIIADRFDDDLSLAEIGSRRGFTQSYASRVVKSATGKLREAMICG